MFHAVHLISESFDHYNYLLQADSPDELVELVRSKNGDFPYLSMAYVTSEDRTKEHEYQAALGDAISKAWDEENEEESEE